MTAQERIAIANELYAERNKLAHLYYMLDLETLKRVNRILAALDENALREVATYAEGLAAWAAPAADCDHATVQEQGTTAG